jgi:outer membrane receptor protein involved in Fe transport
MKRLCICFWIIFLTLGNLCLAQTTGKISGKVTDKETGQPLIGVNVLLQGTTSGAATDYEGEFFIINIPPGNYNLVYKMLGYETTIVEDVRVSVNRTTNLNAELSPDAIEIDAVVIKADKVTEKKDKTSSVANISGDEIKLLPVESISGVIGLQAGVVNGHFRGGRYSEVYYLIDGVQVNGGFSKSRAVDVETDVVADLEVITGTFNAEYGRAMSGIVNVVTKDGSNSFSGSVSVGSSNYYTSHKDVFIGLNNSDYDRNTDYKVFLSGPVIKDNIFFLFNARAQNIRGYLNGIHRFNPDDYSDFMPDDPKLWYTEHSGNGEHVPINKSKGYSLMSKLSFQIMNGFRATLMWDRNANEWRDYNHGFKYNPNGIAGNYYNTDFFTFTLNHIFSVKAFYEAKVSYLDTYYGNYLYKDPLDPRYIHDGYARSNGPGFLTGGQQKGHTIQEEKQFNAKFDFSFQINKHHYLKTGVLYTHHNLSNTWRQIQNGYIFKPEPEDEFYFDPFLNKMVFPFYEPYVSQTGTIYADIYNVKPVEFSGYIQDKIEYDNLVMNAGVRYDYFNPNSVYPSERRNPSNSLFNWETHPERMSTYPEAEAQYQVSPRFGLAYQLGNAAVLRFSYGHFFQMPPFYSLYQNHSFTVGTTDYSTVMGNSQLKAEKTVQYEVGLWQQLIPTLAMEVAVFYRDIYDLLSTKIISTFNQVEYGLYTNKDYGNAKGMEIKIDFKMDEFYANLNYTLQYTRGNADNPTQTFSRAGDSKDPIPTLISMSWDQRHTLNLSAGYSAEKFGINLTSYYNSGAPYTWTPISDNRLANINLYPNNSFMPARFNVDMSSYYNFYTSSKFSAQLTLNIYNLLDRLNESWVNSVTGRAYTAIVRESERQAHNSDFNTYDDRYKNPSMYGAPREVKLGVRLNFNL